MQTSYGCRWKAFLSQILNTKFASSYRSLATFWLKRGKVRGVPHRVWSPKSTLNRSTWGMIQLCQIQIAHVCSREVWLVAVVVVKTTCSSLRLQRTFDWTTNACMVNVEDCFAASSTDHDVGITLIVYSTLWQMPVLITVKRHRSRRIVTFKEIQSLCSWLSYILHGADSLVLEQ